MEPRTTWRVHDRAMGRILHPTQGKFSRAYHVPTASILSRRLGAKPMPSVRFLTAAMSSTEQSPSPPLPNRSAEVRRDAIFDRWVLISPARARRPSDFKSHSPASSSSSASGNPNPKPSCAFCAGREGECAPEIFRVPPSSSADWKIRVIENLYPALRRDAEPPDPSDGLAAAGTGRCAVTGFGFHDVVIETPDHSVHLPDLSPEEVGEVLLAYKQRIFQLARLGSIKYVQAVDLGGLLKLVLQKLSKQLNDPPYNLIIQTAPFDLSTSCTPYTHWFLQILPHLNVIGGFEIGTGCFINPVFPEDAAKVLREVDCSK
ncbi:Galactose-1-phosphate uridyl [Musa troglodytarum]|uniref:Galactose-1-phosphate uridyl n=1 Tax=Musa troglodytarum TaxID=320322 RepID=A0A9E7FXP6_9LILI|nr:Galactose-1-phosphate uridyl [Musa troglodytarum]